MAETFTDDQVRHAISQFLEWGEQTYKKAIAHNGCYYGDGWPARVLKWHSKQLEDVEFRKCLACGDSTNSVVNIKLKPKFMCDACCMAITAQTVIWMKHKVENHE